MLDSKPDADALFRAGREAFRPQASDRERVLRSLTQSLGALPDRPSGAPNAAAAGAARLPLRVWVLGGVGALAVGAGVLVAPRIWTKTTPSRVGTASSSPAPTPVVAPAGSDIASSVGADEKPSTEQAHVESPTSAPHPGRSAARSPSDPLLEEVRLLSQAEQELNDGHAEETLKTLDEHERKFPNGALAEERMAARVQSLCALGRVGDARTELTKLARAYPRSPHLESARRSCGIDVGPAQ